jgi:hypothetical protein
LRRADVTGFRFAEETFRTDFALGLACLVLAFFVAAFVLATFLRPPALANAFFFAEPAFALVGILVFFFAFAIIALPINANAQSLVLRCRGGNADLQSSHTDLCATPKARSGAENVDTELSKKSVAASLKP